MVIVLAIVGGLYLLRLAATILNLRALDPRLPPEFAGVMDEDRYRQSQAYTREKSLSGIVEDTVSLAAFLVFWLAGGFTWLHGWSSGWGWPPLLTGVGVFALVLLAQWLISLPFNLHDTFVTEEKYGFNRTDARTWVMDQAKSLALVAVLGAPLLVGVLWILGSVALAWLWAWLVVSLFSLVMAFLAPSLILPLFNKFQPLEDGDLREGIEALASRCAFPLSGVFVMDGSKRSSKANAFFTGFGRHRRIALFDTLIDRHGKEELLAVLAHEIGHFKKRHIWQQMLLGFLSTGILFFLLGRFLHEPTLYGVFGVPVEASAPPVHFGLIFFLIIYRPVGQLLAMGRHWLSRRHEFEADAFAASTTGSPDHLAEALRRLSSDSLSNLTPHPLLVWLDYTHPPTVQRLRALDAIEP